VTLHELEPPSQDGGTLFYPPLDQVPNLLAENHRVLSSKVHLLGRPFGDLRAHVRNDALGQAAAYLRASGESVPPIQGDFLVVAGHQPDLFHPGVWLKNFALQALARRLGGTALNLVVDNDVVKHTSLRVPTAAGIHAVPYDHWQSDGPYEERHVLDEGLCASLPARVRHLTAAWPFRPLLDDFWPVVGQAGSLPIQAGKLAACPTLLGERLRGRGEPGNAAGGSRNSNCP